MILGKEFIMLQSVYGKLLNILADKYGYKTPRVNPEKVYKYFVIKTSL